jgi:hypothetical protein
MVVAKREHGGVGGVALERLLKAGPELGRAARVGAWGA